MDNTYLNIVSFVLTTYLYYLLLKPQLTYEKLEDVDMYQKYLIDNYAFLAVYIFIVIIIQCVVNINVINEKCGGGISDYMGYAGLVTIVPWILIFGVLVVILTIYPGFKSAFADVIGYYWVSTSANEIITDLLINKEIDKTMPTDISPQQKQDMQNTADAIVKICGNSSVLINQMAPSNYKNFWDILVPLMKPQYRDNPNSEDLKDKKIKLFDLVVSKDNIGEGMWYLYTGLVVTSLVQLNIYSKGCVRNPKTMEADYEKFMDAKNKAKAKADSVASNYNNNTDM